MCNNKCNSISHDYVKMVTSFHLHFSYGPLLLVGLSTKYTIHHMQEQSDTGDVSDPHFELELYYTTSSDQE